MTERKYMDVEDLYVYLDSTFPFLTTEKAPTPFRGAGAYGSANVYALGLPL